MTPAKADRSLLIIDDDRLLARTIADYLAGWNLDIHRAGNLAEALAVVRRVKVDLVLLDQKLPDGLGLDLCGPIIRSNEQCKVIFITAFPSFDNAVKAIRVGAHDYLSKPFELEELSLVLERALRTIELEQVEQVHRYNREKKIRENIFVGDSAAADVVRSTADIAARSRSPVLITGETGTGKGIAARTIGYHADGGNATFVSINCASLPENLIEAELFGHEKGAYTGAEKSRKGLFEMADGGALFLDEIGELPLHLQSTLLGVLDNGRFKRVGSDRFRKTDTRIITATNVPIETAIAEKRFRQDLYYRLGVIRIHIPPLRERLEDLMPLCMHFLQQLSPEGGVVIPDAEMQRLKDYSWPGNVRELRNIIERSILFRQGDALYPARLLGTQEAREIKKDTITPEAPMSLAEMEYRHIAHVLRQVSGNRTRAAAILEISRSTLMRKIRLFGLGSL